MSQDSFWLVSIENSYVSVALISRMGKAYVVSSSGAVSDWSEDDADSLNIAVDESLSDASTQAQISEDQEPQRAAFILPPYWVGSDGKIVSAKLKLIENLCKSLALKPTGFIANDEAIVEEANSKDGFPASFILVDLDKNEFTMSLVYLGKVKERIRKSFPDNFNPALVELALLEIDSESTLPPQIIIFGKVDESIVSSMKNYAWIGKKNIETFLHFPDIRNYSVEELNQIYTGIISAQIPKEEAVVDLPVESNNQQVLDAPSITEMDTGSPIDEVMASELGFGETLIAQPQPEPELEPETETQLIQQNFSQPVLSEEYQKNLPGNTKKKISLDFLRNIKIKRLSSVPRFHHGFTFKTKFKPLTLSLIAVSPLLILIPFYFSSAKITLFVTPYSVSKKIPVVLDTSAEAINRERGVIPVEKQTFTVESNATVKTTGQKTVGDKAKGEITIFNKQDKSQNIPKGAILIDSTGKKFQLINAVVVASSSSDLERGVINLGQTKTVVEAADIGPEYNIPKDTKLAFKDISENLVIGKVTDSLSGGNKRQINSVSNDDKTALEQKISQATKDAVSEKINKELAGLNGSINETIQTKQSRIEYSREIGEEADELSANAEATVSVFVLDPQKKEQIVDSFLSSDEAYRQSRHDINNINIEFKLDKIDDDKANGAMTLTGKLLPDVDIALISKNLSGKSQTKAAEYLKKQINRVYNYHIDSNFKLLGKLNPLPFRPQNIIIDIKTESL